MRARAVREGSVGLLILIGVVLFGGLVLWLRGINPGSRNYTMTVTFDDTVGMQVGTTVRYRGVPVGRVVEIEPSSNQVNVVIEVTESGLKIPEEDLRITANQSGFIGETIIDITPGVELAQPEQAVSPNASDCESGEIVCDGDRLDGITGVSYESLLQSAETLTEALADPELLATLSTTLQNTAVLAEQATSLTSELTELTLAAQEEIGPVSNSVQRASDSAAAAAQEFQLTATDVRTLIDANRTNLTATLSNLNQSTMRLASVTQNLATEIEDAEFLENLDTLSANAVQASVNFRSAAADIQNLTSSLNQPENLILLQQTLESARDVFQSGRKVLSDVDELTGDPAIRNNVRDLIYGLSDLVSSAEILEQQIQLASALGPLERSPVVTQPNPAVISRTDYEALQHQLNELANSHSGSNR